ncbi:hypothetical protein FOZ62_005268 [Perkinsus olseni]|uniref:Uncharacterized protein n=1 Tax=Perkinsus olseni TaxID=32597 RepID=A0A7J6NG05_PEROL|nr:hypothetical protein FOZ62_005268 [Perkinsus olseni]
MIQRTGSSAIAGKAVTEISSILDKKDRLNLASSIVEFQPMGYGDTPPGWFDDEDDNEGGAFFNENDDDIAEEYEEPKQHFFGASSERDINTATTELPIAELKEVCSAVMEVVKDTFPDFNHLCSVSYKAAEEALTAAKLGSWQFIPITSGRHRVVPPENE